MHLGRRETKTYMHTSKSPPLSTTWPGVSVTHWAGTTGKQQKMANELWTSTVRIHKVLLERIWRKYGRGRLGHPEQHYLNVIQEPSSLAIELKWHPTQLGTKRKMDDEQEKKMRNGGRKD